MREAAETEAADILAPSPPGLAKAEAMAAVSAAWEAGEAPAVAMAIGAGGRAEAVTWVAAPPVAMVAVKVATEGRGLAASEARVRQSRRAGYHSRRQRWHLAMRRAWPSCPVWDR